MNKFIDKYIILLFVLWLLGNSVNRIFLIISILLILFRMVKKDDVNNFYFSFFLVPNIRILDGIGVTFIINIVMVIPLIIYLIRKKMKVNKIAILSTILLFSIEILHTVFVGNWDNFLPMISTFCAMLYCLNTTMDRHYSIDLKMMQNALVCGIYFSTIIYLLCDIDYLVNLASRITDGYRFVGYAGEPNYFALYITVALSLCLINGVSKESNIRIILLVAIGIMTASKMFILVSATVLVIYIIFGIIRLDSKTRRKIFALIFFGIIISILFKKLLLQFWENLVFRAGGENITLNSLTSQRSDILDVYIKELYNDFKLLIFGYGLKYNEVVIAANGYGSHNTFLDVLLSWGIVGVLCLSGIIYCWVRSLISQRNNRITIFNYLPLIVLLMDFMSLSCLNSTMFWFMMTITFYTLTHYDSRSVIKRNIS